MKKRDVIIACDFPSAQATLDFLKRFEEQKPLSKSAWSFFMAKGRISCGRSKPWATTCFWI